MSDDRSVSVVDRIQEYLELEKLLIEFFSLFDFCATSCSQNSSGIGCCDIDYYKINLESEFNRELFNERKRLYGIPDSKVDKCDYHCCKSGCMLKSHRAVSCNGYACQGLRDYLWYKYTIYYPYNEIRTLMWSFVTGDFDKIQNSLLKDRIKTWILKVKEVDGR